MFCFADGGGSVATVDNSEHEAFCSARSVAQDGGAWRYLYCTEGRFVYVVSPSNGACLCCHHVLNVALASVALANCMAYCTLGKIAFDVFDPQAMMVHVRRTYVGASIEQIGNLPTIYAKYVL